jgi:hypothetical protein
MKGDIKTTFNLAQLEKMLLEKMKFSVSLAFTAFNMNFDILNLISTSTSLEFSLPNTTNRQGKVSFLYAIFFKDVVMSMVNFKIFSNGFNDWNTIIKYIFLDLF